MVRIKLARVGKSKDTSFRVIVTDRTKDPFGNYLEVVGTYNPRTKPKHINLNKERILYWISKGAQPTDSLHNLFVNQGIIEGKSVKVNRTTKNAKPPAPPAEASAPAEARPEPVAAPAHESKPEPEAAQTA